MENKNIGGLPMTNQEIVESYKSAKDQKAQIKILSELNNVSKSEIRNVLIREGVTDIPPLRSAPVDSKAKVPFKLDPESASAAEDAVAQELPGTVTAFNPDVAQIAPWGRAAIICGLIREGDSEMVKHDMIAMAANVFLEDATSAYGVKEATA